MQTEKDRQLDREAQADRERDTLDGKQLQAVQIILQSKFKHVTYKKKKRQRETHRQRNGRQIENQFRSEGDESETKRSSLNWFIQYVVQSTIVLHLKVNIYMINNHGERNKIY